MGTWGINPWDSDKAADWYSEVMESCRIREKWLEGMRSNLEDDAEVVRAAVGLFLMLGRVYVWPIKQYDKDLELAISKCEALLKVDELEEVPEFIEQIRLELQELQSRREPQEPAATAPERGLATRRWWKFWGE